MKTLIFIFAFAVIFASFSCQRNNERIQNQYKKQDFKGVVIKKYQDWNDRGRECLIIFNFNTDTINLSPVEWRKDNIWDYVRVGDSIIKPLNQLDITVKRKNDVPRKFRYQDVGFAL